MPDNPALEYPPALTEVGFDRPTYADLLAREQARAVSMLGEDMDTSEISVLGKILRIWAFGLAGLYEDLEGTYYARFPHFATGVNLDRLLSFAGISRNAPVHAEHEVTIHGTPGFFVEAGYLAQTESGITFETIDDYTIADDGTVVATFDSTEAGEVGNVPPGSISIPLNPDGAIQRLEHTGQSVVGRAEESDYEVRSRFDASIYGSGTSVYDAVRGAILRVSGVTAVILQENETDEPVYDVLPSGGDPGVVGIPPHAFRAFVLSNGTADAQEIAQAIFAKKPLGIKSVGDVQVEVLDSDGLPHAIGFSWVGAVSIHVRGLVRVISSFPDAIGTEADPLDSPTLATVLAEYISAFVNGRDVVHSSLYSPINGVLGVADVVSLEISTDGVNWATDNIIIAPNEVAFADPANIQIGCAPYVDY